MAKAKKEVVEETAKSLSKSEVVVRYRDYRGETINRVYSKELHGADFKALATEFAEKKDGTIV